MTGRFTSNLAVLLAGGFLVVAAMAFAPSVSGWLGLATGCVVTLTTLVAAALPGRGAAQRTIDVALLATGGWTIVAARSFDGPALRWLMFANGTVAVTLAVIGLVAHEVLVELALGRSARSANGRLLPLSDHATTTVRQPG